MAAVERPMAIGGKTWPGAARMAGRRVWDTRQHHAFDTQSSSDFRSTAADLSEVDGWVLIIESNGFLGVTPTVAERLAMTASSYRISET